MQSMGEQLKNLQQIGQRVTGFTGQQLLKQQLGQQQQLINQPLSLGQRVKGQQQTKPQIDWEETLTYVIKADVPGLKIEELSIEVEDGKFLHLRGEKQNREAQAQAQSRSTFRLKERVALTNFVRKLEFNMLQYIW